MRHKTSPISVILVSSGSRGNKLLFRYPFQRVGECPSSVTAKQRSPYALNTTGDGIEDQDGDSRYSFGLHLILMDVSFIIIKLSVGGYTDPSEIQVSFLLSLCFSSILPFLISP
uniref:NPR3 like, GATOR1 complex subunit n=1 Tax=Seriola lalandi dorsalis TaxID=1841481 RepID=A0A3B4XDM2_SERLL